MKNILFVCLMAFASVAFAKGSSYPKPQNDPTGSGIVPIENAQKVMYFYSSRLWHYTDGTILVCPFDADASNREKECTNKTSKNAWVPLLSLQVPGYEIAGVQFVFTGSSGYMNLLVYWRKSQ